MGRKGTEIDIFIARIKKKFNPEKIILFGSRARGEHLEGSDYDILVVSSKFKDIPFLKRMELIYELWDGDRLDVICYTPDEFERKKKQICIVKKAVEEGILIQ